MAYIDLEKYCAYLEALRLSLPVDTKAGLNAALYAAKHFYPEKVESVVYCKNCRYRFESSSCGHPRHHGILPPPSPNDFCNYGQEG